MTTFERECPKCGNWIELHDDGKESVYCPVCNCALVVDYDAEFKDGSWMNLTTLHEIKR